MSDRGHAAVFFELPEALPRGQHGLTREQVRNVQRERLLRAFTELLAEDGYANVRIAWVCERAGVSNATFYELFSSKEECVCAAYERYLEVVWRRAAAAGVAKASTWREFIQTSLDAYFDVLAADPVVARGFHVEMRSIGPEAGRRQAAALHAFAEDRMRGEQRLRKTDPQLKRRPFTVHLGTVQVVRAMAREALEASPSPDFRELRVDLVDWFVASWYGEEPATEREPARAVAARSRSA
jgi:AcrR family transcriptional regulator